MKTHPAEDTHTRRYAHTHTHTHTHKQTHPRAHRHADTHTRRYAHAHTHTDRHAHTQTHTDTHRRFFSLTAALGGVRAAGRGHGGLGGPHPSADWKLSECNHGCGCQDPDRISRVSQQNAGIFPGALNRSRHLTFSKRPFIRM